MVGKGVEDCWLPCFCLSSRADDEGVRPIGRGALRIVEVDDPAVKP